MTIYVALAVALAAAVGICSATDEDMRLMQQLEVLAIHHWRLERVIGASLMRSSLRAVSFKLLNMSGTHRHSAGMADDLAS
jgi:hypothetical protein